jgi:hypothetical protein
VRTYQYPGGEFTEEDLREMFSDEATRATIARITGIDRSRIDEFVEQPAGARSEGASQPRRAPSDDAAFEEQFYAAYAAVDGGPAPSLEPELGRPAAEPADQSDEDRMNAQLCGGNR